MTCTSCSSSGLDKEKTAASGYVDIDGGGGGGDGKVLDYRDHRRGSFSHPRRSSYPGAGPPLSGHAPWMAVGSRAADRLSLVGGTDGANRSGAEDRGGGGPAARLKLQPRDESSSCLEYPSVFSTPTRAKRMKLPAGGGCVDDVVSEPLPAPWPLSTGREPPGHGTSYWAPLPSLPVSGGGWCGRAGCPPSTFASPQGRGGYAGVPGAYTEPSHDREFYRDGQLPHHGLHDRRGKHRSSTPPAGATIAPPRSGRGGKNSVISGTPARLSRSGTPDAVRPSSPLPGLVGVAAAVGFEAPAIRKSCVFFGVPGDSGRCNHDCSGRGSAVVAGCAAGCAACSAAMKSGHGEQRRYYRVRS